MKVLIKNGTLIDPANKAHAQQDLLIENGLISKIGHIESTIEDCKIIDATNCLVAPGLVDLRARFREPGLEYKATIASEARAAAKAGITSVCLPPDTDPVIDRPSMAHMLKEKSAELGTARIYPLAALTKDLAGKTLADVWSLTQAGCVGTSNAGNPIENTLVMRRAMQYSSSFDITVHLYAQDHALIGNGCIHEGATSTRLGLPAIPAAAEIVGIARDIALIETTGVKAHFTGISCARSVEMIANAQQRGLNVTADVDIHHLVLCEDDMLDFDTHYHVQPPLRTANDRTALCQGVKNGVIQAICSDHQPHDIDSKQTPFGESSPGISGLETLLPLVLKLVKEDALDIDQAINCLTNAPATILGIEAGTLSIGAIADCCIIDPNKTWTFNKNDIHSSGKNSPYIGQSFSGQTKYTLIGGHLLDT